MKKVFLILTLIAVYLVSCDNRLDWIKKKNIPLAPTVINLNPAAGAEGTVVIITGSNFSSVPTDNIVMFNGVAATVTDATSTTLTVKAPVDGTTGGVTVTVNGKEAANHPTFTFGPIVTNLTPATGLANTTVIITGNNFTTTAANNFVTFNGVPAKVTAATATELTVTVPATGTTGPVSVTVNKVTATNQPVFTYQKPAGPGGPIVTTLSPSTGFAGSTVVITGSNFSAVTTNNTVTFNGTPANVTNATATQLTVTVPANGSTGVVSVTVNGQTAINQPIYTYGPVVTSLAPSSGLANVIVIITGTGFSPAANNNTVTFNNTPATVTAATATQLTVTAPATGTTGPVIVRVNTLTATNQPIFTYGPVVTSLTPSSGLSGTVVTIAGNNFSTTTNNNTVKFNGVAATVTNATTTQLTVTAPAAATTGPVAVTVSGITAINQPTFIYGPIVTTLSPSSGASGTVVTINGNNFSTTLTNNTVTFNGVAATVTNASPTQLTVTAPATGTTGPVAVTSNSIAASSQPVFTYLPPPTVSFISPTSGANGASITISGQDFSTTLSDNIITINGVQATVTSATATSLTVTVPTIPVDYDHACIDNVPVQVTVSGQPATNQPTFSYQNFSTPSAFAGNSAPGLVDGNGTTARFRFINIIVVDNSGNVIVADAGNGAIRRIDPSGNVSTLALIGGVGGMDVDATGNVYAIGQLGIKKITPAGVVTTLNASNWGNTSGIAIDNATGNLYFTDITNKQIVKLAPDLSMTVLAGSGVSGTLDGQGTAAQFDFTMGFSCTLVYDGNQNLYVSNGTLRKITLTGAVSTVNNHGALGIATDNHGNLYLSSNTFPGKLASDGTFCALKMQQLASYYFDVDSNGNTYVGDSSDNIVYKITP